MTFAKKAIAFEQGVGGERILLLSDDAMNARQQEAAAALVSGPRKGIYGPFIPLMRNPELLERVALLGETLRFEGKLPTDIRELVICIVARHVHNQFEWVMHVPLALAAGISASTLEAIRSNVVIKDMSEGQQAVYDFCIELLNWHEVADPTYQRVLIIVGEEGIVELSALIGYFAMVSWVMNVARTPSRPTADVVPLF